MAAGLREVGHLWGAAHARVQEKWKFLQKYYHKGAYFQEEDETGNQSMGPVMMQDFGKATGKDSIGNKAEMPKVMQVKNFGMRSQVKWTHLTNEDTSSKEALWGGGGPRLATQVPVEDGRLKGSQ